MLFSLTMTVASLYVFWSFWMRYRRNGRLLDAKLANYIGGWGQVLAGGYLIGVAEKYDPSGLVVFMVMNAVGVALIVVGLALVRQSGI